LVEDELESFDEVELDLSDDEELDDEELADSELVDDPLDEFLADSRLSVR
jgi:hypothetical protein